MTEMSKSLVRCHCGKLYHIYSMIVRDQSKCSDCEQKLKEEYAQQQKADSLGAPPLARKGGV